MFVEKSHFKVENGFTYNAESEVPRFYYACMDWSDWNLVNAFALDLFENVFILVVSSLVFRFCSF